MPPEPENLIAQAGMISQAHLQSACCDLVADVARNQGQVQLKVAGASMVPTLWPGDLVTVRSSDPSELQPGSIVVFRQNERLVVHRLVRWADPTRRAGDRVVTRGDARPRYDQPVRAGEVLGRVDSALRNGRPVNLQPSLWHSVLASVLRRSDWGTQIFLRLSSRLRKLSAIPESV
jgi:signal peptidase I